MPAFALALLLAQVNFDKPFVPAKAVCFRAEMAAASKPDKPVYKKAALLVLRDAKECQAKAGKLAALCDASARTQYQGEFKALYRSPWERDRALSASIQSSCAKKPGTVTDVTRAMNSKAKAKDEVGGYH